MEEHDPGRYGAHIADLYDQLTGVLVTSTDAALETLFALAEGGPVLEFGIGTGRLALPLAARGLRVAGIDGSEDMVARLRTKPGGRDIEVGIGDFSALEVPGEFALVVLAYNTVYALPSQDAQVACFANAARHLRPGGRFLVEAWVPDPDRFARGQRLRTLSIGGDEVLLEAAQVDPVQQRMVTMKVLLGAGAVRLFPATHRYAWPAELDLMAQLAGMRLEARWGDWQRAPFTAASPQHVSVYVR